MKETATITTWHEAVAVRDAFVRLNRQWIERYFKIEPCDEKIFANPGKIVDDGGEIFIALVDGVAAGCCALVNHGNSHYELAKMAVDPNFQGHHIGLALGETVVAEARRRGAAVLSLEANTALEASVGLYHRLGFEAAECPHPAYGRCNLYMELKKNLL